MYVPFPAYTPDTAVLNQETRSCRTRCPLRFTQITRPYLKMLWTEPWQWSRFVFIEPVEWKLTSNCQYSDDPKEDGIHRDGSFLQHKGILYNGNYGKDLVCDFALSL